MKTNKTKIMVFGTFDGVHLGHLNFFKQARGLTKTPFLIISIARDVNVEKIKGEKPEFREAKRIKLVKETKLADKVILASKDKYLSHILKEKPDIIALGYDQKDYVKELKKDLKSKDIKIKIVRLKSYKKHIYKNHLLKGKNK
ncbi:MAG: adenylyltransferase/cytidyltransferase family protein [Candidatus Paceibacterota bacterium]